eukprot:418466-Alexandrium_andersonii.AAC.1
MALVGRAGAWGLGVRLTPGRAVAGLGRGVPGGVRPEVWRPSPCPWRSPWSLPRGGREAALPLLR